MRAFQRAIQQVFQPDSLLRRRLVRAIRWSVLGAGAAQALYLLASILIARLLGNEDFGRLGLMHLTLNTLVTLISPSFGWSIMRAAATMHAQEREALAPLLNSLMMVGAFTSGCMSVGLLLLTPTICTHWFADPKSTPAFQIGALSVFANGYFSLVVSLFAGLEAFRGVALLNTVRGLLLGTLMLAGAYWGGLNGAAAGFTIASVLGAAIAWYVMRRVLHYYHLALHAHNWQRAYRLLTQISLPSFLSTVVGSFTLWAGGVLLTRHPDGLHQVAVFNASNQWKSVLLFLPTQISQASAPIMANLWGQGDLGRLKAVIRSNLLLVLLTYGLPCAVILALSSYVLHLYLLAGFQETQALRLLTLSGLMSALCSVLGYTMIAMGKGWQSLSVNLLWMAIFLTLTALWLGQGALGISKSYLISYSILFVVALGYVGYALTKQKEAVVRCS